MSLRVVFIWRYCVQYYLTAKCNELKTFKHHIKMTKEYTTSMETEQLTYYSSFNTYTNTAIPVANVFQDI